MTCFRRSINWAASAALLVACVAAQAQCYATPDAAVAGSGAVSAGANTGWRVQDRGFDSTTGFETVRVARCENAAAPWQTVVTARRAVTGIPLVRAGMQVQVRAAGTAIAYSDSAVALESGAAGSPVRVQLHNAMHPEQSGPVVVARVVSGSEVEWRW